MAEIKPFRGVRYNPHALGNLESVVAPPYDVVSPALRERLAAAHPHNVIRLELPTAAEDADLYESAVRLYRQWLTDAVLQREASPALYPYAQTYRLPSGEERTRAGFLTLLKLHEYEEGVVLPHEETLPKAKEDRFRLLSTARAQFSPIFGIYDPGEADIRAWLNESMQGKPVVDVADPGQFHTHPEAATGAEAGMLAEDLAHADLVRHRLWVSTDPLLAQRLADTLATLQVFIVDGHHRYETALRHRRERGAGEPWTQYIMIFLVATNDTGLVVLPTHRVVTGLSGVDWEAVRQRLNEFFDFDTHPLPLASGPVQTAEAVEGALRPGTLAMLAPPFQRLELLKLRDWAAVDRQVGAKRAEAWRRLDVVALHTLALAEALGLRETRGADSQVTYSRDAVEVVETVIDQPDRAAFFVSAPSVDAVRTVALAGEKMPEKSTYFWPKAITGLVIYDSHSIGSD